MFGLIRLWITKGRRLSWLLSVVVFSAVVSSTWNSNWTLHFPPKYHICPNIMRHFVSHWVMYRKHVRTFRKCNKTLTIKACTTQSNNEAVSGILSGMDSEVACLISQVACLISHYWLWSDISLTFYWEMTWYLACKETPTFLCGYFRETKLRLIVGLIRNSEVYI